ncbi:ArnT family glycosyltransferase [Thermopirellula anaerolimosa]
MRDWVKFGLPAVLTAAVVFFFNLGGPRLWDRDEPRNAGCAWEMIQRGDWVTPYFNGEIRDHKPVLLYWFMMSAYAVFGVNEFAARFWSALLAVGTVALTFDLGRRWVSPRAGLWAGIMLASCMMFPVAARAATPDSVLIFFTTAALWCYAAAILPSGPSAKQADSADRTTGDPRAWFPTQSLAVGGIYGLMGLAVLAKGPIGFLLPAAIIGLFMLWQGIYVREQFAGGGFRRILQTATRMFSPEAVGRTILAMRPLWAVIAVLLVAGPWHLWVGLRTDGAWLRGFYWTHNVSRFIEPMEGHGGPIFYYPAILLLTFFPWSLLLIPAVMHATREWLARGPHARAVTFFASWGLVYVGFFSLAGTKLPSYITPSLPAFALITGWFLDTRLTGESAMRRGWLTAAFVITAIAGLGIAAALPPAASRFLPGEESLGLLGLILACGGIVALAALRRERRWAAVTAFAVSAVLFAAAAFGIAAERVSRHQKFARLAEILRREPDAALAAFNCLEPSWVFYTGRKVRWFAPPDTASLREFLVNSPSGYVITTEEDYRRLAPDLPDDVQVVDRVPYFLEGTDLVLLRRAASRDDVPMIGSREKASSVR